MNKWLNNTLLNWSIFSQLHKFFRVVMLRNTSLPDQCYFGVRYGTTLCRMTVEFSFPKQVNINWFFWTTHTFWNKGCIQILQQGIIFWCINAACLPCSCAPSIPLFHLQSSEECDWKLTLRWSPNTGVWSNISLFLSPQSRIDKPQFKPSSESWFVGRKADSYLLRFLRSDVKANWSLIDSFPNQESLNCAVCVRKAIGQERGVRKLEQTDVCHFVWMWLYTFISQYILFRNQTLPFWSLVSLFSLWLFIANEELVPSLLSYCSCRSY